MIPRTLRGSDVADALLVPLRSLPALLLRIRDGARRARAGALLLASLLLAVGCTSGTGADPLVARCAAVLGYEQPEWSELEILSARPHPRGRAVTLRFEALAGDEREPVTELIACAFRPEGRPALERVVIGDRALTRSELALANAELLLQDLGRGGAPTPPPPAAS